MMAAPPTDATSGLYVKWQSGSRRFMFETTKLIGSGHARRKLSFELTADELIAAVKNEQVNEQFLFGVTIKVGRGMRNVMVAVDADKLHTIADAIRWAADDDDVGHRFYHLDNKLPRPCDSCRETIERAANAKLKARTKFVGRWARSLRIPAERIEALLADYTKL